jgi:hypothetical protein
MFSYKTIDNLSWVHGKVFEKVRYGFSTRVGGVSSSPWNSLNLAMKSDDSSANIGENWSRFMAALDLEKVPLFFGRQTHGIEIKRVVSSTKDKSSQFEDLKSIEGLTCVGDCDALWTDEPAVAVSVFTADCLPILVAGRGRHPFVAALHGGWRGLASRIISTSLSTIASSVSFIPEDLTIMVGPHIGSCCFEVSADVAKTLGEISSDSVRARRDFMGKYLVDLGMIVRDQCADFGIPLNQIHICELCTCCNEDSFYSYRRARTADRGSMSSVIAMV